MVLTDAGRYADAQAVLERAFADSEESGERWSRSELQARLAVIAIHREDLPAAEVCSHLALELRLPDDPSGEAESHYALGQLRAAQGRTAEA